MVWLRNKKNTFLLNYALLTKRPVLMSYCNAMSDWITLENRGSISLQCIRDILSELGNSLTSFIISDFIGWHAACNAPI